MNDHIVTGKIIGAHGIRGEVKVFPITDNVRRFNKLKKCVCFQKVIGCKEKPEFV
jgi:16S rRNA processing protein RimM